jgi:integrase
MTRYPKSGTGRKWTVAELKAIAPAWRGDTLADGDGLVGEVRVAGDGIISVHFRFGFKYQGKKAWHYCGTWPTTSLEHIRDARDQARLGLKSGLNPNAAREAGRIEAQAKVQATIDAETRRKTENATFNELFETWLRDGVLRKDGNARLRRSFEKDMLPTLGAIPVRSLTEHDLRDALRKVVQRESNRVAVCLFHDARQLFAWAEKRQPWRRMLLDGNPAALIDIEAIVPSDYDISNTRTRTLSRNEIAELNVIFERMDVAYEAAPDRRSAARPLQRESRIALWICLATGCRIGELLMSEWKHLDLEHGTWFIPMENVKGTRGKKQEHRVYLSPFALRQFKALHTLTGALRWCFPSRDGELHLDLKTISKQVGDRQQRFKQRRKLMRRCHDDSLVLSGGRYGAWTPHDLRRTAATMMQALGVSPDVIDRCQNHILAGSKVRRHYLTHEYAAETREAWAKLGAEIESVLDHARPANAPLRARPSTVGRQQAPARHPAEVS